MAIFVTDNLFNSSRYFFLFFIAGLYFYFLFYYPFAFNFEVAINYHYYIVLASIIAFVLLLSVIISQKIQFKLLEVLLLTFITIFVLYAILDSEVLSNEYLCNCFTISVVFLVLRVFNFTLSDKKILLAIASAFFIEVFVAVRQIVEGEHILGTLTNTGVFSCYLVAHLPLFYFTVLRIFRRRIHGLVIFLIIFSLVLAISYLNNSRTAFLSVIFLTVLGLTFDKREILKRHLTTYNRKLTFFACAILMIVFIPYILQDFFLKKQLSAHGRLMKLEICSAHFFDNFWLGLGLGKFTYHYPSWQADFFCNQTDIPISYFLSADESYLLFNDYLQLYFEVGIFGFMGLLFVFYTFFRCKTLKDITSIQIAKFTVVAIMSFAFTSYPFYCTFFLFLGAVCFATAYSLDERTSLLHSRILGPKTVRILFILLLGLSIGAVIISIRKANSIRGFSKIYGDYFTERKINNEKYLKLYSELRRDGKFLLAYGEYLIEDSLFAKEGIRMIEDSKRRFISYRTYNSAAAGYENLRDYSGAIENYRFLSCFVPSEFYPKYELVKLFNEQGDTLQLRQVANVILNMPVKIPSAEVNRIKSEVRLILEKRLGARQ